MKLNIKILLCLFTCFWGKMVYSNLIVVAGAGHHMVTTLQFNGVEHKVVSSLSAAIKVAARGDGIIVLETKEQRPVTQVMHRTIRNKQLKVFMQFPSFSSLLRPQQRKIELERAVWLNSKVPGIDSLAILSINDQHFYTYDSVQQVLAVVAKVAGFDKAEYGISDVQNYPLLFWDNNILVSSVRISDWKTARFGPEKYWENVWNFILKELGVNQSISWISTGGVEPSFARSTPLVTADFRQALQKGTQWYLQSKLLVGENWQHLIDSFTRKNGEGVVYPGVGIQFKSGDGKYGILEGHASVINKDGSQPVRWWLRGDCQAETAFALTTAARLLNIPRYDTIATNLLRYLFKTSNLRQGERNDPKSPSFGLIGWATTDPDAYYGDDNARVLLGTIGAATNMGSPDWNTYIIEGILGNFRTTGKYGFRGPWFRDAAMQKTTWQALAQRPLLNVHPHYESWLWALYLWLYDKTGYEPLKQQAVSAITITMEKFPEWKWTNGIQQEYGRMLLPLAWLVQVENTPRHRDWLKLVALTLLKDMDESGAIKERLGIAGLGRYDKIKSNAEYGTKEAPLIAAAGDKVTDLLYTLNYTSFGLNEAFAATGDTTYKNASQRINDFFVRVQINAPAHKDLDGAWFRAFDFGRWEYWASNADSGWGPWGTQTGWTQSWILNALGAHLDNRNFWEATKQYFDGPAFKKSFAHTLNIMLK